MIAPNRTSSAVPVRSLVAAVPASSHATRKLVTAVNRWRKQLGREPLTTDFSEKALDRFLKFATKARLERSSRIDMRSGFRRLWLVAHEQGLVAVPPRPVAWERTTFVPQPAGTFERAYQEAVRPKIQKLTYQRSIDRAVSRFRLWRGGPTPLRQMTDELIDQFQAALVDSGMSKDSVADYPQIIRRVLRLIDRKLCRPKRAGFPGGPLVEGPPGTLSHFVRLYAENHDLAPASAEQLRFAVHDFDKHLCRVALVTDLNADTINEYIAAKLAAGLARHTLHRRRGALLCLWREGWRRKLLPPVEEVRRVKVPVPIPRAWFEAEFAKLLAAADAVRGVTELGVTRAMMLRAILLTGYYTGLRPCDLFDLRSDDVLSGGVMVIRQKKTGEPIELMLPADCIEAIEKTGARDRALVFPLARKRVYDWLRQLLKQTKLDGTLKWLRRTGATRCEQQQPGSAKAYLGHLTDGLAHRHYVDRRQIKFTRPVPPSLTATGGAA